MAEPTDTFETLQRDLEAAQTIEAVEQYIKRVRGLSWMYQEAWARARYKLTELQAGKTPPDEGTW